MLFMAIASHKLISGLALSSRFLKEGATTRQVRACMLKCFEMVPGPERAGLGQQGNNGWGTAVQKFWLSHLLQCLLISGLQGHVQYDLHCCLRL